MEPATSPHAPVAGASGGPAFEDVPFSQVRKTIAKRLAASLGPVPHYFLTSEVDMERPPKRARR
jgi:pyruvate dehydrogenase E2 component (dihydrolipoamide acetyltransferase)